MDESNQKCSMTGLMGIIIQVLLGVLSFSVLLLKRCVEKPKRRWRVWILDTSKQMISQLFAHFINLGISIVLTYQDTSADECLWYFTTNILDNTFGVFVCVLILTLSEHSLSKKRKFHLVSGNYYEQVQQHLQCKNSELVQEKQEESNKQQCRVDIKEEQPLLLINYGAWGIQLAIWNSIVILSKLAMFGVEMGLKPYLKALTFAMLGWIEQYPVFELILVIVIVPVTLNALAFWVQDNFLMKKNKGLEVKPLLNEVKVNLQLGSNPL